MSGPHRLGMHVKTIAGKALGRNGMAFAALLAEWPSVVGSRLSEQTAPLKLVLPKGAARDTPATLHLAVNGPVAVLVQHEEPQILERINAFFGWRAVARLKLVHGAPTGKPPTRRPPARRRLSPLEEKAITEQAAPVADPGLREALERLGRAISGA